MITDLLPRVVSDYPELTHTLADSPTAQWSREFAVSRLGDQYRPGVLRKLVRISRRPVEADDMVREIVDSCARLVNRKQLRILWRAPRDMSAAHSRRIIGSTTVAPR
jgi:hypothetical protein